MFRSSLFSTMIFSPLMYQDPVSMNVNVARLSSEAENASSLEDGGAGGSRAYRDRKINDDETMLLTGLLIT